MNTEETTFGGVNKNDVKKHYDEWKKNKNIKVLREEWREKKITPPEVEEYKIQELRIGYVEIRDIGVVNNEQQHRTKQSNTKDLR